MTSMLWGISLGPGRGAKNIFGVQALLYGRWTDPLWTHRFATPASMRQSDPKKEGLNACTTFCKTQPSSIHWLSSPIFPSPSGVRPSRIAIPHNCHNRPNRRWCTFFKSAYLFPQRTWNGLLLGKFIQRIKTPSMPNKIPSTPNKTQSTPTKIPSTPNKTPKHSIGPGTVILFWKFRQVQSVNICHI